MPQYKLQALPSGTRIGVYEIKGVISTDWSGILYCAWNEHLNMNVIIKEYLPEGYAFSAKFNKDVSVYEYGLKQFLQLADQLAEIKHPNIVSVFNIMRFNGTAYLVMDFVNGIPLSKIHFHSFSSIDEELTKILRPLLNALQIIHNKKIVHGNINPANIIIRDDSEPVLINFASANIALSDHCKQNHHNSCDDFSYIKDYHPDSRSSPDADLYSLGASLFYTLVGSKPESILSRKRSLNINSSDPCQAALKQSEPDLSEELLKTILWMFNPNPKQRAQSAEEVLEKLDRDWAESEKQKNNVKKLTSEPSRPWLLQFGIAGGIVLVMSGFWYNNTQYTVKSEDRENKLMQVVSEQRIVPSQQLTSNKEKEINQYLLAAKKNLENLNLTTPPENNAYDQFQAVLSIDQGNTIAINGLKEIYKLYIKFIKSSAKKGELRKAKIYLKRAEAIQSNTAASLIEENIKIN